MTRSTFPNLARSKAALDDLSIHEQVDRQVIDELTAAGIKAEGLEPLRGSLGTREVPTKQFGSLCGWGFQRAWYYWIAEGPGIPPDLAEYFHRQWGRDVRVAGHCGCPSPLEWHHGFAVGMYHIDTQDGLNAFAELLRSICRKRPA